MKITIPNQITIGRLVLAIVFFALLTQYTVRREPAGHWLLATCFWIFLAAAISDVVDGWLARSWGQVTPFGRIVDPVVDKVLVCGAFIFFAGASFFDPVQQVNVTGVAPWMAVLILLRELLVSAVRSFLEAQGSEFAANWVGKVKMFVQSATACVVLGVLAWYPVTLAWLREACVWATVVVTAISILAYAHRARAVLLSERAMAAPLAPSAAAPVDRTGFPRVVAPEASREASA